MGGSQTKVVSLLAMEKHCEVLVCAGMLPIIVLEDERYKKLVFYLQPKYFMPARATVTEHMEKHVEKMEDEWS